MTPGSSADSEKILYGDHSRASSASDIADDRLGNGMTDIEIILAPSIRMIETDDEHTHVQEINCAGFKALQEEESDEELAVEDLTELFFSDRYSVDTGDISLSRTYYVEDRALLRAQIEIYCEDQPELFDQLASRLNTEPRR